MLPDKFLKQVRMIGQMIIDLRGSETKSLQLNNQITHTSYCITNFIMKSL